MKWLTNAKGNGKGGVDTSRAVVLVGESQFDAQRRYNLWLQRKIIGRPKATAGMTVEELEAMGSVGVYAAD